MNSRHFRYVGNELQVEGVPLSRIAEKFGTPVYVYSEAALLEPLDRIRSCLSGLDHLVCFAAKANSNLSILRLFAGAGAGLDAVSGGELFRARKAGVPADRIVFSGVGKTEKEMEEALRFGRSGILAFNVESAEELTVLNRVAERVGRQARFSIRLNPDVDPKTHPYISTGLRKNKFGLPRAEASRLARYSRELRWVSLRGASVHIGSQLLSLAPLREAFRNLSDFAEEIVALNIPLSHVDLGGGLGIPYRNEEAPSIESYCALIQKEFGSNSRLAKKTSLRPKVVLEPGRLLAGNAGVLVSEILFRKKGVSRNFLIIDAAMNDLIRPALYESHHEIVPLTKSGRSRDAVFDVVGPVCETSDVFGRARRLPGSIARGDLVAVLSAGAYGFSMASQYNSRTRVAEVLVSGNRTRVIRRRETYEDLIRGES
ncbi:MAG: diaminopimelate decarboxylase [Bdellovibrionales bacterium GWB1_55_8]|nr:MAG: diaminopimelate decarboxylase [Bdellovibrionales bacterium GWB1_55_8]